MLSLRLVRAAVLGSALVMASVQAQAAPLFDFATVGSGGIPGVFIPNTTTLGYRFEVSADITVDGIGIFDYLGDGLASAHQVALWNDNDKTTPLVTAILNPGSDPANSDPSVLDPAAGAWGSYIYANIVEMVLGPGFYTLGASYLPANGNKDLALSWTVDPIVENSSAATMLIGAQAFPAHGNSAQYPNFDADPQRYLGPNLRLAVASIPEPLTLAMLVTGLAGAGLSRRNGTTRGSAPDQSLPA